MCCSAATVLRHGEKLLGSLTIAAGIVAFLMIAAVPHKRIAVPEILAAVTMGMWTFSMGMKLLVEPTSNHELYFHLFR